MGDYQVMDCWPLLADLNREDSRIKLKRRLLMGLPLSNLEEKRIKILNDQSDKSIPEALLREDDEYYDKIKNFVERVLGAETTSGKEKHAVCPKKLFENGTVKHLSAVLDRMTNKGLCSLSELVTKGSRIKFKKTKLEMKKIIKKHIRSYLDCENRDLLETRKDQISTLLNNPHNFSGNRENLSSSSSSSAEHFRGCAIRVLDMLKELSRKPLESMLRRLTSLEQRKALPKHRLVKVVRSHCMKMLCELDENNPRPPESLVEALSMAGMTLKLILGHTDVTEFKRFSPEVEALQDSILKAIRVVNNLDETVVEAANKKLRILSEPGEVETKKSNVRIVLRDRLVGYLVECGYMEKIPKPLVEILNDITRCSWSLEDGSSFEDEVEFLLCFSAQIKQVIWDNNVLRDEEIDQDFATAYMEEPEDGGDDDDDDFELDDCSNSVMTEEEESIGETNNPDQSPNFKQEPGGIDDEETDSVRSNGGGGLKTNRKDKTEGRFGKNKYLWIQRACDETAMTMDRTVDGILKELTKG